MPPEMSDIALYVMVCVNIVNINCHIYFRPSVKYNCVNLISILTGNVLYGQS
jgi:hypothetical protein